MMSSETKNVNTLLSTSNSEKENNSPNIQISKEYKKEKCQEHNWKPVLFYCSCGKFLCVLCLKNHCHSNMNFCDIKSFYNNVLREMEQILKLIDKYSDDLKNVEENTQNNKLESIMYTKTSLIKDNNLFFKINNSISDYLQGVVASNEEKIKKLIKE